MQEIKYIITDPQGIHARPAGELVKVLKDFACAVTISKDDKTADAKRIFGVMSLAAKQGQEIVIRTEGEGEAEAIKVIESFLKENL